MPDGDETKALRSLTRAREDLVAARVELANQLRAQLLTAICPATLIAELGDARGRYPTEATMAADAGMSRRARARGQDHPHAIRTLGRAWIRVLWRCWRDRVPYDPARHGNFRRLEPAGG